MKIQLEKAKDNEIEQSTQLLDKNWMQKCEQFFVKGTKPLE
jgi:general stress protein 26